MSKPKSDIADSRWVMIALCAALLPYTINLPSFMHAKEIAIGLVTAALFVRALITGRALHVPVIVMPIITLILASLALRAWWSPIAPIHAVVEASLRWSIVVLAAIAFTGFGVVALREALPRSIAAIALGLACLMPFQYLGLVPWFFPDFPDYGQPMYSVFGNQAILGGFLAIGFAAWGFMPAATPGLRALRFAASLAVALAAVATGSMSAWAAVAAAIIAGGAQKGGASWSWIGAGALAMLAAIVAYVADHQSIGAVDLAYRPWFWRGSMLMILDTPVFGGGIGSFAYRSPEFLGQVIHNPGGSSIPANGIHTLHVHNDYLEFFADTGLLGFLIGIMIIRILVRHCDAAVWKIIAPIAAFATLTPFLVHVPFAVLAIWCAIAFSRREDLSEGKLVLPLVAGVTTCAVVATLAHASWYPGALLQEARAMHLQGEDAGRKYVALEEYSWPQPVAMRDYGSYLVTKGESTAAFEAYQRAESMGLDTVDVYKGIALAGYTAGPSYDDEVLRAADAWIARWPRAPEPWAVRIALGHERADVRTDAVGHIAPEEWIAVTTMMESLIAMRDQRE